MLERTRARPARHDRRATISERFERKQPEGSERTELFAHLPYTYGRLGQLGSQTSSVFFLVLLVAMISPIRAQLMRPFLSRRSFLQTLRPEPVGQGSAIIEMRVNETRRSRRLFHAWWEM